MLHRAATTAYSWWWASHIRTKQSKWLEQNLQGELLAYICGIYFINFVEKFKIKIDIIICPIQFSISLSIYKLLY